MTNPHPKLEHVNLVVTAIEPTVAFLTAAFPDWRVRGRGDEHFAGMAREWVHVGGDNDYVALTEYHLPAGAKGAARDLASPTPGLAHIGFEVASVDEIKARLKKAGYEPTQINDEHPHRRRLYFVEGDNLEFEFIEYLSDKLEEKNSYD